MKLQLWADVSMLIEVLGTAAARYNSNVAHMQASTHHGSCPWYAHIAVFAAPFVLNAHTSFILCVELLLKRACASAASAGTLAATFYVIIKQ
jgi:hypothetical protein